MVINGKVRQACSALIDQLSQPIVLQPMKKFPLVRDLAVDRQRMFEALRRSKEVAYEQAKQALAQLEQLRGRVDQLSLKVK